MEFSGGSTASAAKSLSAHLRLLSLWLALRLCTPPKAARFQLFPFTVARTFICLCAPLDCDRVSFSDTHAGFLFSTAVSIRLKIFRQTPPAETHIVFLRIVLFYAKTNTTYRLLCAAVSCKSTKSLFSKKRNVPGRSFYRRASFGWFLCLRNSESALHRLNLHQYTASVVLLCCLPLHMSHQCTCLCLHITADSFFKICNQLCLHLLRLRHSVAE